MMRTVQAAALVSGVLVGQLMTLPTAHAADLCSDFGGAVEPDGLCRVHQNKPNYTLTMSFPVDFPDQAAVNDFLITQTRSGFLNETQTPNFANVPYAARHAGFVVGVRHDKVGVVRDLRPISAARIRTPGTEPSTTTRSATAR